MKEVCSREYKVMVDHRLFADRKPAAAAFWRELCALASRLDVECQGNFNSTNKREIVFLDTKDQSIALNGFVFRQRHDVENGETQYTLKCRSPDRYVAAGAEVRSTKKKGDEVKLEEDIAAPFLPRFSHSGTIEGPDGAPKSLAQAAELFPVLGRLRRDDEQCSPKLRLQPVNQLKAFERVMKGPMLHFGKTEAEVALILWSDGPDGRPLVGEFSFRYGNKNEKYSAADSKTAMRVFLDVHRLDWIIPDGRTKTQYAYRA